MREENVKIKIAAVVPSAGAGRRFKSRERKPFANLNGRPVLSYALKVLQSSPVIGDIVLVMSRPLLGAAKSLVARYGITKVSSIVPGGKTRSDSVRKGLLRVDKNAPFVLIHDGVRPFVTGDVIRRTAEAAFKYGASVSAVPVKSTMKIAGKSGMVRYTPPRDYIWEAQTPQVFKKGLIEKAYRKAARAGTPGGRADFTDDAALIEGIGAKIKIVPGDYRNIKITTAEDIRIAEALEGIR